MQDIERLDAIAALDKEIKLGEALVKLKTNVDFKYFMDVYTKQYVLEQVNLLGTIEKDKVNSDNVTRRIEAVALFTSFIEDALNAADNAKQSKLNLNNLGNTTDD